MTPTNHLNRSLLRLYASYAAGGAGLLFLVTLPRRTIGSRHLSDHDFSLEVILVGGLTGTFLCALRPLRERGIVARIFRWVLSTILSGLLLAVLEHFASGSGESLWQTILVAAAAWGALGLAFWWIARNLELSI
jgi:hypothetical protein